MSRLACSARLSLTTGIKTISLIGLVASIAAAETSASQTTLSERRLRVDVSKPPWNAIAQINNAAYGRCTGVLIGPNKALTAAHCLFNKRTATFLRPQSIHLVLGYDRGNYAFATTLSKIEIPRRYDPAKPIETVMYDIAVLHFQPSAPTSIRPLAVAPNSSTPGTKLRAVGYGRDRLYSLTSVSDCRVEKATGMLATLSNCPILEGYSGGPLIDTEGRIAAIQAASGSETNPGVVLGVRPTTQFE